MDHQLRVYRIKPGLMEEFLALWRDHVVAARRAHGFEVVSSYVNREEDVFVWTVRYTGDDGFAAGDQRYYTSDERSALPWNPLEAIASAELELLEPYSP